MNAGRELMAAKDGTCTGNGGGMKFCDFAMILHPRGSEKTNVCGSIISRCRFDALDHKSARTTAKWTEIHWEDTSQCSRHARIIGRH